VFEKLTCVDIISGNDEISYTQKDAFLSTKMRFFNRDVTPHA